MELDEQSRSVLSCDISMRPETAAGLPEIMRHLIASQRTASAFILDFTANGKADVQSFVDAERQCCTELAWKLADFGGMLRLEIGGTADQLDVVELWFSE
jgi:hypothetical protein